MAFKLKYGGGTANANTPGAFSQSDTSAMQMLSNNGNGKSDPPAKKYSLVNLNAPTPYDQEYRAAAQRLFPDLEDYGNLSGDQQVRTSLEMSIGPGSVMNEGGILEQRRRFEEEFGKGSSRMFDFLDIRPDNTSVRKMGDKAARKKFLQDSKAKYESNRRQALNYQQYGSFLGKPLEKQGVVSPSFSLPDMKNIPLPGGSSTAVAKTSKKRKKKKLLKGVGQAIGSVGRGIGDVGEDVVDFVGDVGEGIGKGIRRFGYRLKGRGPRVKSRGLL